MLKNRCAYLRADHTFELREEAVPTPAPDEILVQIKANGICGSDIHFFQDGRLGNFVVTVPYIPGHESSGVVAGFGEAVKGFAVGERIVVEPGIPCGRCARCHSGKYNLCADVRFLSAPPVDGTFCDYVCVRADFIHKVPEEMPFEHAAMVEPAAVAVHAVGQAIAAGPISGKPAVVLGVGPIGLMVLQAYRAMGGGEMICVDVADNRLEMAKKLGAAAAVNARNDALPANSADIIFEAAGRAETTAQMPTLARPGGTIVQVGWPAGDKVTLNIADFMEKELTYKSVNRYANAFPAAIRYLCDGRIDPVPLITQTYAFADVVAAFELARDHPEQAVKVVVMN